MSLPSVSAILRLPALVRAAPEVAAGAGHLGNKVRWVHVSELGDISRLLRGGELLLTTGIALDLSPPGLQRYVESLADRGVAGLVVEFGRRFAEAPPAMVGAAERHGLPLVVLRREARFVEITEQAHAFIIDSQVAELRFRQEIHEAFTEMAVEGADARAIVGYAARAARRPVLLTTVAGAVVHLEAGSWDPGRVLEEWQAAAHLHRFTGQTELLDGRPSWLVCPVKRWKWAAACHSSSTRPGSQLPASRCTTVPATVVSRIGRRAARTAYPTMARVSAPSTAISVKASWISWRNLSSATCESMMKAWACSVISTNRASLRSTTRGSRWRSAASTMAGGASSSLRPNSTTSPATPRSARLSTYRRSPCGERSRAMPVVSRSSPPRRSREMSPSSLTCTQRTSRLKWSAPAATSGAARTRAGRRRMALTDGSDIP